MTVYMQTKNIEKYFFLGFLTVVLLFTLILFKPFFPVIIVGAALSVVLHPLYTWFRQKLTKGISWIASIITVVIFVIILLGPVLTLGALILNQTQDLFSSISTPGASNIFLEKINVSINHILPEGVGFQVEDKLADFVSFVYSNIASIFTTTLSTLLSFILIVLTIFYFLKDGDEWKDALVRLSPLADEDDEKILNKLSVAVNSIVKGYLFIAVVQGCLMGVGLAIFGVPSAALWGVLSGVASLVPTVGTALVTIPAVLFLLAIGNTTQAIGMTIWGIVVVGTVDNFLNPIIMGRKTDVPPFLILLSVLGGISLMGPVGILVGPLTMSLLYALVSIYRHSFQSTK